MVASFVLAYFQGEVVKYRTDDVVFATMDAQLYVDFCVGTGNDVEHRLPSILIISLLLSCSRLERVLE